jgi:predicted nucleic acid-binding protein
MLNTNVLISVIVSPNGLIYKAALDHRLVVFPYIIDELLKATEQSEFLERY